MEKHIFAAASFYNKKYFFDEACADIPGGVQAELSAFCKSAAEMIQGIFYAAYDDNDIIFGSQSAEDDLNFDEIGARLITDRMVDENPELVKSLRLWHALYKTEQGKKIRKQYS